MRKNIFKRLALLSTVVLSSMAFCGYKPVEGTGHPDEWEIDNSQFVYDYGNVFTNEEELGLQEMCEKTGDRLGLDIVIVVAKDLGSAGNSSIESMENGYRMKYADDFYDYGGYSESGLLYLIDLDYDGIYISTAGMAMVYFDDAGVEKLLDAAWVGFEDYDYYKSAKDFVDAVDDMVSDCQDDSDFEELEDAWIEGDYDDYGDFYADYSDEIDDAHKETLFTRFKNPLTSAVVALIIAAIAVLIMCFSVGTKMTASSRNYLKDGRLNILHRYDRFSHTTTSSYKVNTSSGGGGGTSSHRSSSGGSHGGGGRSR